MPASRCTFCLSKARAETAPGPREALREELLALRPSKLERRARSLGIDELALDAAKDSESVVAMVELVIAATPVQPSADALREELASLRPSALERRARSLGVSEADLDEAKDSDTMSAKEAMIELVVAATPIAPSHDVRLAALHKNLAELKPSAIEKRAREAGVTEQQLDEAKDSDEPREALVHLILAAEVESPALRARPELQPQPQAEPQPEPEPPQQLEQAHASSARGSSEHPLYRALAAHQLEDHYEKLRALGVKRVEDLEKLTKSEIDGLQMLRFDRQKFHSAFVTETPHHGPARKATGTESDAAAAPRPEGFSLEGGKHVMFSYVRPSPAH
jgi:2-hydroxychromene-2-carboxylate isomerase